MNIREYYPSDFRHDIIRFMPDKHLPYFGHSWHIDCRGLEKVLPEHRAPFLVCLYFTVLADQAMHAYYPAYYQRFEALTRYPKFCHGLGQFQKNPRNILLSPIEHKLLKKEDVDALLSDGMKLLVDEVINFCTQHMPEIHPQEFFDKLLNDPDVQIPLIIVLADPAMKTDTGVLAYEAMRQAVKERVKGKPTTDR
jgi:hypothetical protein